MNKDSKIFVAGHTGMVGAAILRKLQSENYTNIVVKTHKELDLVNQQKVNEFFAEEKPEYVFLAAAKVGGIMANKIAKTDFLYDNIMISMNITHTALEYDCKKLLFLGSSCIYPKLAPQPIKEDALLTSSLEPTNEGYALAKISGLKYAEYIFKEKNRAFISVMPTNLYGIGDNYDKERSHVLPALIRRFHEAKIANEKSVICFGDGSPLREFLFVDDLADLCVFLMNNYNEAETINAGVGKDITIKELAKIIAETIGFKGEILWDTTKPNGTPRKLLDVSKATNLGWTAKTKLKDGIKIAYEDFLKRFG